MRSNLRYGSLVAAMFLGLSFPALAQKGFFNETSQAQNPGQKASGQIARSKTYSINAGELRRYLAAAPGIHAAQRGQGLQLEVPLPDGKVELFDMYESQVMTPELAAQHPDIKTYSGSATPSGNKIKLTLSPNGFNAMVLGVQGDAVLFEKIESANGQQRYRSYSSKDVAPDKKPGHGCGSILDKHALNLPAGNDRQSGDLAARFSNGSSFKRFRLAIAATGEYTAAFGGGDANTAYATIVAYVNEISAVYETELGVTFQLVSGTSVVYTNPATDPFTANNQGTMLDENQIALDAAIGNAGYDLGHVFGAGGSGSGGGLAASPSVCQNSGKARGASDIGDEQFYARVFSIQLIAHEIGHQFGMSHSYNSNIPVCTTREYLTSVEPGSGATIMSYGFTCSNNNPSDGVVGNDDYGNDVDGTGKKIGPFLNFHVANLIQAINYIGTLSCYTTVATGNATPVINAMTTSYTIPKSTPFALTGTATDADAGNSLSYSWEGTDISDLPDDPGPTPPASLDSTILPGTTHAPFFRSYAPVTAGTRTYPLLSAILNGTNYAIGDKLPSIATTTTHTLTVRDNAGGTATEDVTVTIDNSGPFLIVNDPSGSYNGGSNLNVAWSVNGTDQAPVNSTLVDILLSTDGGNTFSSALASGVPNSGTASVTLPLVSTSQARIKVMPSLSTASGNTPNIFFDISNTNFSISTPLPLTSLSFDVALVNKNEAQLTWKTTGQDFSGFDVEMSRDGVRFEQEGHVSGLAGSSPTKSYEYHMAHLSNGTYFFRLKMAAKEGRSSYSPVRQLTIGGDSKVTLYPNPASQQVVVEGIVPGSRIVVTDINGKVYKDFESSSASAVLGISQWTDGVYLITVTEPSGNSGHYKIVKIK